MATTARDDITVLVVDDHRTFAEALRIAVGLEKDFTVHVVSNGEQAVELAARERPEIVLMDVEMPGLGGVDATRRIREVHPEAKVVMLSAHDDPLVRARALEAGARGFLSKLAPMSDIADALRRAHKGEPLVDRTEEHRLLRLLRHQRHQDSTERQRANRLTPRQTQILQLMADGVPVSEIAERLNMAPATLRTHVQNTLTRLGVHSQLEALALAIRQGKVVAR